MTAPVLARWAARLLEADADPAQAPVDAADRLRSIAAIERALVDRRRRTTRLRWAFGISLAASVALCAGLGGRAMQRTAHTGAPAVAILNAGAAPVAAAPLTIIGHVSGNGASISNAAGPVKPGGLGVSPNETGGLGVSPNGTGEPLVAGSRVVAHGTSHAILAFSTGTELSVEDEGDMTILEGGRSQVFALDTGAVRAHVAKLGAGERFVVHTPDAEVEVRGTSFRVAIVPSDPSCGAGSVTRVTVDEGVVVVRHARVETRVAKGETWPSRCDASSSGPVAAAQPEAQGPSRGLGGVPHETRDRSPSAAPSSPAAASSLADQNDAFAEALTLKHSGQDDAAVSAFERFVLRYPTSNLAESAAVERMKILLASDHAKGVAAAAQYLRRYPGGFARADAMAAVGER